MYRQRFLINNDCFKAGKRLSPKGIMLHSVGVAQPSAARHILNFDRSGFKAAVHAFIDGKTGDIWQTLPWTMRAWHCGGAANDTHIGVEMCEPDTILYTSGASWIEVNREKTEEVVSRTFDTAVELFADLCDLYDLDPLADGVIISHSEGYRRGVASNHADVEHIWREFGLTMDGFRRAVAARLNAKKVVVKVSNNTPEQTLGPHEWAEEAMRRITELGIMKGDENGDLRPRDNLTREEFAVMEMRHHDVLMREIEELWKLIK